MGTAIKHAVPDRVKPSFVILASECQDVKNYKWRLNPVWHRMLYSCTHMATVGFKGFTWSPTYIVSDAKFSEAWLDLDPPRLLQWLERRVAGRDERRVTDLLQL